MDRKNPTNADPPARHPDEGDTREYDEAERSMIEGWNRRLPDRELVDLVERKVRAWNYRRHVVTRV